jgi:RNA polymerase sigma factor (sigma-70 family)
VYERWDKLERPGAYLRRCVVNRAMRHNRRRVRGRPAEVGARRASTTEMSFDHTLDAVAGLEEKARTVVVLRYYASLTQEEIAETLGIPTGTVKSRLHRALADLRKVLS